MALNFNDPACGFYQREVVDFLNEQILQNGVSPYFYLCKSKSWRDMERKLRDIVTNRATSRRFMEACAWSSLVLAVQFAVRQKLEDTEKVKKLRDQLEEQKLLTTALRGTVSRLRGIIKEREKEKAQSQLQQSLPVLHGVEEGRNLPRSELCRVLSTQSQQKARTQGEEKEKEAQTSGMLTCSQGTASCWLMAGAGKESDQETAAAPGMAAVEGEAKKDKVISLCGSNEVVANFSCPQFLGPKAQAGQQLPLNLSQFSYSSLSTVSFAGATAEAAAAPPVNNSRNRWNGKHSHTRRFLPGMFKQYPGVSHSAKRTFRRRMGDWDCAQCCSMNFLWRTTCFKCKTPRHTRESRGSAPNWGPQ
ncbi:testis-expressed protein 13C-1-like [Globicephala melas]|uniref:testis-expressed protein 13C-1-like n=1 Tax=Globicephala melas TaxID=9731 RepID=UPI0038733299